MLHEASAEQQFERIGPGSIAEQASFGNSSYVGLLILP